MELDKDYELVGTYYAVVFATESEADGNCKRDQQPQYALQHGTSQLTNISVDPGI